VSWLNSARSEIKFTSPEGNVFRALWRQNERSFEKKLGVFDPPRFRGSIVQDMDTKSVSYPLTIYFEGANHYTDANDFFTALKEERGQWEIIHPTKGFLVLQLVSCKENIDPMESGNFTEFSTAWLEPANIERLISVEELVSAILLQALNAIEDAITQLKQLRADLYAAVNAVLDTINQVAGLMDNIIAEIAATQALINDLYNEARNTISNVLSAFQADPADAEAVADIGQAVADLGTIPVGANTDFSTRYAAYSDLITSFESLAPTSTSPADYNQVISQELAMSVALVAIAQITATSNFTTRAEVVTAMDNLTIIFNQVVNALEEIQDDFSGTSIDLQYFSQSTAYGSLQKLYALCLRYLLSQFYNLKVEKRFTLKKARSPLEITITEYGSLGENDENYDLFITSNNLCGDEILLLPAGTEVVVYA